MSLRILVLLGALLLGVSLGAQPFVDAAAMNAKGYAVSESAVGSDGFGGTVGTAVDPTDPDAFYYYDGLAIRRFSLALGSAQGTGALVFAPPAPVGFANQKGGVYGTMLVFDPADGNSLWFVESSDANFYVITLDPIQRNLAVANRVAYQPNTGFNVYDIAFDTSGTGSVPYITQGNFTTTEIIRLTTSPTSFTGQTIGTVPGASGPLDFDSFGNLYYVVPPFSGTPATSASEVRMIRWLASTVAAAGAIGGTPLTEANRDPGAVRTIPFASSPGVFPSVSYILARTEGGRPVIYAGSNDPVGAVAPVTGSVMRIDITMAASNDDLLWLPLTGNASPGKIGYIRRTGGFGANEGQWDETGGARNGRIYVPLTHFDFATSPSSLAMIVPNSTASEIVSLAVTDQPAVEHIGVQFGAHIELRDAGGNPITTGTASTLPVTLSALTVPTGGAITGTLAANAVRGVATLSGLGASATGAYALQYTAGAVTRQTSLTINRIAAINLISMPGTVTVDNAFTATAELVDEQGMRITQGSGASANVILAIQTGPTGGVISGGTSVTASGGVANFPGLLLNRTGGYVLSYNAFVGALSQAAETAPIAVQTPLSLSAGGSGCTVGISGQGSTWQFALSLLVLGGLATLLWLRRSRMRSSER